MGDLIFDFKPDGTIDETAEGFKGGKCEDALKLFERVLGKRKKQVKTQTWAQLQVVEGSHD